MPPPLPPPTHRHPPTPLQPLPQSPPPCPPLSSPAVHTAQHVEVELYELGEAYRDEYLAALGVLQGGLAGLVQATYRRLGLRTYFTAREKVRGRGGERGGEMREEGCTARGNGHGVARGGDEGVDNPRGHDGTARGGWACMWISYDDFVASGSYTAAKEKGLVSQLN
ncbi:unnamed protein product [Closterium sp. NIES-65]|nr:unnamed protein product [Closterium sp. NIES-65]